MLTISFVVAVITAWLRGGRFQNAANIELHGFFFIVAPFVIKEGLIFTGNHGYTLIDQWGPTLNALSYLLLAYGLWSNRHLKGMWLATVGTALNFIVVGINAGRMPVSTPALRATGQANLIPVLQHGGDLVHALITSSTRLWFLGDVIILPHPFPRPTVLSIGDALLVIAAFIVIHSAMLGTQPGRLDGAAEQEAAAQ